MYQQMLAAGEYDSAAEYDTLLALARDEFETEVAREEYEKEVAQEENAKHCCNPFPCPYNGKNSKSCDECGFFHESEDECEDEFM